MIEVVLKVNEKDIPLNDFMEQMLTNLLLGYLKTAKEIPDNINKINVDISF
ncbi:MAG: hypothetical protein ACFFA6_05575 [Promethearchaeota archaeon]